jgi:serine/threonine-protein kinase RsbW
MDMIFSRSHNRAFFGGMKPSGSSGGCDEGYPDPTCLDLPADYTSLSEVNAAIETMLKPVENVPEKETLVYQIRLAVHEACTNIINHAYGGCRRAQELPPLRIQVDIALYCEPRRLVIDLYDTGASGSLPDIQLPEIDEDHSGGYGLFLIHQLMDQVSYQSKPEFNHWQLVKLL